VVDTDDLVGAVTCDLGEITEGLARDTLIVIFGAVFFFQNFAKF
jgi:hypothetical protein